MMHGSPDLADTNVTRRVPTMMHRTTNNRAGRTSPTFRRPELSKPCSLTIASTWRLDTPARLYAELAQAHQFQRHREAGY